MMGEYASTDTWVPAAKQPTEILWLQLEYILNKITVTEIYCFYFVITIIFSYSLCATFFKHLSLFCFFYSRLDHSENTPSLCWRSKMSNPLMLGLPGECVFCQWNEGGSGSVLVPHLVIKRHPVFSLHRWVLLTCHENNVLPGSCYLSGVGPRWDRCSRPTPQPSHKAEWEINVY